ncbi:MAG: AAA family ATPase [Deltaproteobacteria bacterium]|nr:AAA family ATPase [Deltaproteobacteria bacterium]
MFKGLWIYNSDLEWKKYPVVRLDFSKTKARNKDELINYLTYQFDKIAQAYGIVLEQTQYDIKFDELLTKLSEINKVVVLIDEYDKPIIDNIENKELAIELHEILKGFYTIIKACDEHTMFVFLTGVSKFSKAGVFSGLNNLDDISMDAQYSSFLGMTRQEVGTCFKEHIAWFAKSEGINTTELIKKITYWYNGFCFSGICEKVFNPFSMLLLLDNARFSNYWFEIATPSFLIKLIKEKDFDLTGLDGVKISESAFSSYEIENLKTIPILFQTGYLTIAGYNKERMEYTLAYPNFEVKNSMTECLTEAYSFVEREFVHGYAWKLIDALRDHDFELFFDTLSIFFANIPYDLQINKKNIIKQFFT